MSLVAVAADTVANSPGKAMGSLMARGDVSRHSAWRLLLQQSSLRCCVPIGVTWALQPLTVWKQRWWFPAAQRQQLVLQPWLRGDSVLLPAAKDCPGCRRQAASVLRSHAGAQITLALLSQAFPVDEKPG